MGDRNRLTGSVTGAIRRWTGFGEAPVEGAEGASVDEELIPAVDPRTVPVPSGLEVHVLEGEDAGKTFPLDTCEVVLGRRMTPEEKKVGWLLFNDATVSRMHAVLEWRSGPRRYRLTHRSKTNPTFINGRIVQQAVLYPDDMVRLGDLTFQVRVARRGLDDEAPRQVDDKGLIYSGYKVIVANGPDKGKQYVLEHKVVHVGGPQPSTEVPRGHNWLVLTDANLPREQAFFVWYDTEKKYGIFHAGASPVPTQISRVLMTPRAEGKSEIRNLLNFDDMVILGETTLMLVKHERFQETARALRADALPATSTPAEHREEPQKRLTGATPPAAKAHPLASPPPAKPAEKRKVLQITPRDQSPLIEPDEPAAPSIRVRGESLPSQVQGSAGAAGRAFDATQGWFSRPDYGLEVIDGPERGRRIALMSAALRSGKELLIGRQGRRTNDLEFKDPSMANEQAALRFERGRFTLVNQGVDLLVNDELLACDDARLLKNGDEIVVGQTVLLFIDHGALQRQFQFELEVMSENGRTDRARRITLNQDTASIGRTKRAEIRIDDPNVSRIHAQLSFRRGGFVLEHKSETNPTFVNGVSLDVGQERLLQPDDEIQLSDATTVVFRKRVALSLKA